MPGLLQEGIYHDKEQIGKSFCIAFLRIISSSPAEQTGNVLEQIWTMLQDLKRGVVRDLKVNERHLKPDNLSILIGYGPSLFNTIKIPGLKKALPDDMNPSRLFLKPDLSGGGPIVEGAGLAYSSTVHCNHVLSDDIVIQFIADTEFATSRAITETSTLIDELKSSLSTKCPIRFSRFYSGFKRSDNRGWLGFHDSISNIRKPDRLSAIAINKNGISDQSETWIINGTYLAFLRLVIDHQFWRALKQPTQEKLVGRDKLTGCPIIGIDSKGNPVKDIRCPVRGTFEVIEKGNEPFRDHPKYGKTQYGGLSDRQLEFSHIGRTNKIDNIPPSMNQSYMIFRQGFDYLEPSSSPPFLSLGLNFVSFQNRTTKLINILSSPSYLGGSNFAGDPAKPIDGLDKFITVKSAGIFLVPPVYRNDKFPGSSLFFS